MSRSRRWVTLSVLSIAFIIISVAVFMIVEGAPVARLSDRPTPMTSTPRELPLAFEVNRGQADQRVRFMARGRGHALFLTDDEAVLALRDGGVLRVRLLGGSAAPEVSGVDELPARASYLIGNEPRRWRTGIRQYARVRYRQVYTGVDLIFHGSEGRLEYDLVVAPGADPDVIRIGLQGAEKLRFDRSGNLLISIDGGDVVQQAPLVYQEIGGRRSVVPARYVLKGPAEVGFAVDRTGLDPSRSLIIDPVLGFSTYLGGSSDDRGQGIAVDGAGSAYVVGTTWSSDFPLANPAGTRGGEADVFVAKFDRSGRLVYSTYLGGFTLDYG